MFNEFIRDLIMMISAVYRQIIDKPAEMFRLSIKIDMVLFTKTLIEKEFSNQEIAAFVEEINDISNILPTDF